MTVKVNHVSKKYPDGGGERWVLEDVSFTIDARDATAIQAPSGTGKTTLLNMLAGLIRPDRGTILVDLEGATETIFLNELSARESGQFRRNHVGYVYQFFNLVPTLTVQENVLLPLALTKREHLKENALARLERLGLGSRFKAFPSQLSGGEQQRAAIARAVAHEPQILLADEPTGNLDAENSDEVIELLWQEHARLGFCFIVATHSDKVCARATRTLRLD